MKSIYILMLFFIGLTAYATNPTTQTTNENQSINEREDNFYNPDYIYIDSIYEVPMLYTWLDATQTLSLTNKNSITVKAFEQTNLYTNQQNYFISLKSNFSSFYTTIKRSIEIAVSYNDAVSIVSALKCIYEYCNNEPFHNSQEEIKYHKNLTSGINLDISLYYNTKKYRWETKIEFSTNSSSTITHYLSEELKNQSGGFAIYGWLKNTNSDLPELINNIEHCLSILDNRAKESNKTELICTSQGNGQTIYYLKGYATHEDTVPNETPYINKYSHTLFMKNHSYTINRLTNNLIEKDYPQIEDWGRYGTIDVEINKTGAVISSKLILSPIATDNNISNRIISIILMKINEYKFPSMQAEDFPGIESLQIHIPLLSSPQRAPKKSTLNDTTY